MRFRFQTLSALVISLSLASCDVAQAAARPAKHVRSIRPPAAQPQAPAPQAPHPQPGYPGPPYPNVVPIDKTGNYGAR